MQDFSLTIKISPVYAFKYDNDATNRICITNEDSLPDCIDVYTDNFGSSNCAMRYVPKQTYGDWIFNDDGDYFCSKCKEYNNMTYNPKYCPNCGSPMNAKK